MINPSNTSAIILAGGQSRRMGQDKAWLAYQGESFIECIMQAVQPLVSEIIIVANNPKYKSLEATVIKDKVVGCGPLGGLYTGLLHTSTPYNIILSCDVPLISTAALSYLIDHYDANNLITTFSVAGRWQPLVALYNRACLPVVTAAVADQQLRLMALLETCGVGVVDCPEELVLTLTNVNTPAELANIVR